MQNNSLTWPTSNQHYYNPVSKIRSLIKNLDAELMDLCTQCKTAPKPTGLLEYSNLSNVKVNLVRQPSAIRKVPSNVRPFVIKPLDSPTNRGGSLKSMGSTARMPSVTGSPSNAAQLQAQVVQSPSSIPLRQLANIYRSRVIEAYRNRRIFTVYGNYHTVRRALLARGWLEKLPPGRHAKLQTLSEDVLLTHAKKGNDYESVVISKIINHFPPFFIWQPRAQRDYGADVRPYRNRIRRGANLDFSTKVGLIGCAELEEWYSQENISRLRHPRFYRLNASAEERMAFIDDFRFTQCLSVLRYVAENVLTPDLISSEDTGTVPLSVIAFALAQTKRQLSEWEHSAIDAEKAPVDAVGKRDEENVEWDNFMSNSQAVLRNRAKFRGSQREVAEYARTARFILDKVETKHPDYRWDGYRNLWILKPGYQSRGIGIIIRSSLDEILQWTSVNYNRRYIAQKYIERPLLIYKTKFDIRQYMLICIGAVHVSIWMYKECYLRFSSQEFTIDDLRESIHLTNNSVQKKYRNKQSRDTRLPKNNMWSLEQFKAYLKERDESSNIWEDKIWPGLKQNLIAVVLASLEETEFIENSFELYGCDFMLDESYNPILIEINATPDLSPSTEVTARICPTALRDVLKVVVDLPRNPKATTGQFERVFEVNYKIQRGFDPVTGLNVTGTKMTLFQPIPSLFRPRFWRRIMKTPRTERASKKGKRQQQQQQQQQQSPSIPQRKALMSRDIINPLDEGDNPNPLSTIEKEALALRYTKPR